MLNDVSSTHRLAWDLIPWIVNGTASEPERQLAEAHIHGCADCREELDFQRQLHMHMSGRGSAELVPQDSWQALLARLNAAVQGQESFVPTEQQRRRRPTRVTWLAAAVVAQSIGLGALALALSARSPSNAHFAYRTLSSAEAPVPAGSIQVVFAPQMTLTELQALLARTQLRILSGPSEGGVWQIAPLAAEANTAAVMTTTLRQLRADPLVRFAAARGGD